MASRVCMAAAGCAIGSVLFMAGASATLAVADPGSGQGADSSGPRAGTEPGADVGPVATSAPTAAASAATAATPAGAPKPTSTVGDGRGGPASAPARAAASTSKRAPVKLPAPSQTTPAAPGELGVPVFPGTPEQVPGAGAVAAENPDDPDDPGVPKERHPWFGWLWWGPCPGHDDPDDPNGPGLPPHQGGGGNHGGVSQATPPSGLPKPPPAMQLPLPREVPPELPGISADPLIEAVTGLATAAEELPFVPITLPAIVAPGGLGGLGGTGGGGGAGGTGGPGVGTRAGTPSGPTVSGAPRNSEPPPRAEQQNPPAFRAGNGAPPETFRPGYGNYLRTAGLGDMMAIAVPGVTGILVLTGAGGLLGYRQARAGRVVRAKGADRFMG